jgi:hypothetical protein
VTLGDSSHHRPPRRPGAPPRRRLRDPREAPAPPPAKPGRRSVSRPMMFVRYVLPALVVLAGVVAMAFGTDTSLEGGAGLVSAGLAIWFVNWLFRIGATGDAERDAEDRAREYFDAHGRWPEGR